MKKASIPTTTAVIFKDLTADWRFSSCAEQGIRAMGGRQQYSYQGGSEFASHPFYTGKNTLVDTSRIDKFRTRYAKHKK